jgi:hypothetical protein
MNEPFFNKSWKGSDVRGVRFEAMELGADQPVESKRISLSGKVTVTGRAIATLVQFPIQWDTTIAKFVSEPEFNAILTELGRLAAADSNQEQEIFDALSYLINKDDFESAVRFVDEELRNSFQKKVKLLRILYKTRQPDAGKQQELDDILDKATTWHNKRNQFVHSRWGMPDREAGVTKIKFKGVSDATEQVTPSDLRKIADEMESCTKRLRDLFWSFGDYHYWLMKRMPSI